MKAHQPLLYSNPATPLDLFRSHLGYFCVAPVRYCTHPLKAPSCLALSTLCGWDLLRASLWAGAWGLGFFLKSNFWE